jgi:AraC-like DNA-binding protein
LEKSETFTRYLDLIWKECTHYKAQDEKVISSLFQAWLYNLERGVTQKDEESQIPTFLLKARQFITNHYQKPLSLEEIAEHCDISPFYLSREFSATFGEPPISFLINYRLMQAEFLIKYSDSPMTEIASNCGYPNYFHFSKAFKKRHRLSPAQLRRESN